MSYFAEFRRGWQPLMASCLGVALGAAIAAYTTSLFAPELIAAFGWSKAQFALTGSLSLVTLLFVPLAGRYTDRVGPRIAALTGFAIVPITFFAYSLMTGPIWQYYAIAFVQHLFGILTTTVVFTRVIVERFDSARGIALSVLMTGAPLVGAIASPLLGAVIEAEGWRTGYRVLAAISAIGGFAAILMLGRHGRARQSTDASGKAKRPAAMPMAEFLTLARNPAFILLLLGMGLVNLPQIIVMSQLKLLLLENGSPATLAAWIVSLYASGVIVGRFFAGLALDRFAPHQVALFTLGLPTLGYLALASSSEAVWLLSGSVLLIGLAQGSEGDIGAYLTSRKFSLRHYSFIYSFLIAAMGLSSAIGSGLLSFTLSRTDSFDTFLWISAAATVAGALAFHATGRFPRTEDGPDQTQHGDQP